eukprot:674424-Rhodomonas_salina.3
MEIKTKNPRTSATLERLRGVHAWRREEGSTCQQQLGPRVFIQNLGGCGRVRRRRALGERDVSAHPTRVSAHPTRVMDSITRRA